MAQAAVKYFGTNIEDMNCSEQFIELLYHNDHSSYAFLNMKSASGEMIQKPCLNKCALLSSAPVHNDTDTWISLNLFTSGKKRTADNCRELSGFYFDLDKHDAPKSKIKQAITKSTALLYSLVDKKILPMPTIITNTGRGLGVYYIFRTSLAVTENTAKQQQLYSFIYSKLADILEYYFNSPALLEVDRVVINDRTRIVRLPGTYNTAAGEYCSIQAIGEDYFGAVRFYDMSDFRTYIDAFDELLINKTKPVVKSSRIVSFTAYTSSFLFNRVQQMIKLQQQFNVVCTNKRREYMCFVFYNSAKQVYPDAIERLYAFNGNFVEPLNDMEIKHVIKSVDDNVTDTHIGYYKLTDKWIIDKLQLTDEELAITLIGQSQRKIMREAAKEATKQKKSDRNAKVLECLQEGYTYEQAAAKNDISLSTVKRIVKSHGLKRYNLCDDKIELIEQPASADCKDVCENNSDVLSMHFFTDAMLHIYKLLVCLLDCCKKVHFLALCLCCVCCSWCCFVLLWIYLYRLRAPPLATVCQRFI